MIVLNTQHVSKAFGGNTVLRDVSLTLQQRDRLGLVGVNGCGKTTLLRVLCGELSSDGGSISMARQMKIGYLAQQNKPVPGMTVYDLLNSVFDPVREMERKLRQMEKKMAETSDETELNRLGESYTRLSTAFEEAGGYSWQSSIQGVLKGLGFPEEMQDQQTSVLSGGELTRLYLGRLLLQQPDILFLDEPTNHLDLEALKWLEDYLNDYRGSVLVVSHDRYFMDRVCTGIVELAFGVTEQYPGNYSRYLDLRAERWLTRERAYDAQQKEIARQLDVIRKLRAFNREKSIKRAESREKRLDMIERLEKPRELKDAMHLSLASSSLSGEQVLMAEGLSKAFGNRRLFQDLSFGLRRGEKVAVLGDNGTGKTSLLKILTGALAPDSGSFKLGAQVRVGYYDQEQHLFDENNTLFEEFRQTYPRMTDTEIRNTLAAFLFTGEDVFKQISVLSGGEKGRLSLAKLMLSPCNFLILDEPTNHLDITSREVLEEALLQYEGTLLFVSHDRYFINRLARRVLELDRRGLTEYLGNYDDYREKKAGLQEAAATLAASGGSENGAAAEGISEAARDWKSKKEAEAQRRKKQNDLRKTEEAIEETEALLKALETQMADPAVATNAPRLLELDKEAAALRDKLDDLYRQWENLDA